MAEDIYRIRFEADLDEIRKDIKEVKRGFGEVDKSAEKAGKEVVKTFNKGAKSVDKLNDELKETQKTTKRGFGFKKIADDIKKTGTAAKKTDTSFKNLLKRGLQFIGLATVVSTVSRAFGRAAEFAKNFQSSLSSLRAITGASIPDMAFYSKTALEVAKSFEFGTTSAIAFIEGLKLVGSAKPELLENKELLAATTKQAIILSQAAGIDLVSSVAALGGTLNAFNEPATEAGNIINILAAASQKGSKEIPFVAAALTKAGAGAAIAGESIATTVAAIEILGKVIPQAEVAGTGLNSVLTIMQINAAKNGREFLGLQKELELLAPDLNDVTKLSGIFGREQLKIIQILIRGKDSLAKLTEEITDTSTAYEQAAINTDNLEGAQARLNNKWDATIHGAGGLGVALTSLVNFATDLVHEFDNLGAAMDANGLFGFGKKSIDEMSESTFQWFTETRKVQQEMSKLGLTSLDVLAKDVQGNTKLMIEAFQKTGLSVSEANDATKRYQEQLFETAKSQDANTSAGFRALQTGALLVAQNKKLEIATLKASAEGIKAFRGVNSSAYKEALQEINDKWKEVGDAAKESTEFGKLANKAGKKEAEERAEALKETAEAAKNVQKELTDEEKKARDKRNEAAKAQNDKALALTKSFADKLLDLGADTSAKQINLENARALESLEQIKTDETTKGLARQQIIEFFIEKRRLTLLKESEDKITAQIEANTKEADEFRKAEQERFDAIDQEAEDRRDDAKDRLVEMTSDILTLSTALGDGFSELFSGAEDSQKEFLKVSLINLLDYLRNFAILKAQEATIGSLASPESIATAGIAGIVKAAVLTGLITAAFAAAKSNIQSFHEGTENTSRGNVDSRGGFNAILHPNERVVPAKHNKYLEGIPNHKLPEMADLYRKMQTGNFSERMNSSVIVQNHFNADGIVGAVNGINPIEEIKQLNKNINKMMVNINKRTGFN